MVELTHLQDRVLNRLARNRKLWFRCRDLKGIANNNLARSNVLKSLAAKGLVQQNIDWCNITSYKITQAGLELVQFGNYNLKG